MSDLKHLWQIPIGDWSNDGHGRCDWFHVRASHDVQEAMSAYMELLKDEPWFSKIMGSYDQGVTTPEEDEALARLGLPLIDEDACEANTDWLVRTILRFIALKLNDFEWEIAEEPPAFYNWAWEGEGHLKIPGYGCFS